MKTITQFLAAAAVVGAAGVAHADYVLSGGVDTSGGSLGAPTFVGATTVTGSSVFDVLVGTAPGASTLATMSFVETGVYEVPSYADGSALLSVSGISVVPLGGASAITGISSTATSWLGNIHSAGIYQATINWTLTGVFNNPPSYLSEFDINLANNLNSVGPGFTDTQQNLNAYISAVPEPSQAIAGITLLGCGGLVFLGRRFVAKKA